MDFSVETTGACARKLTVKATAEHVRAAFDKAQRKVAKSAQLPGFRPGKVPRSLLERHYGPTLQQEAQTQLIEATLYQSLQEAQIVPISTPRVQFDMLVAEQPCTYSAFIEIRPQITLGTYLGLSIPKVTLDVGVGQVDAELDKMRRGQGELTPVQGRDVVQDGDVVQLDYQGFLAGEPFEGGQAENAMVEVGGGEYIAGFAEGLQGATVPGERDVQVTFPANYSATHLAGQTVTFRMKLKELKAHKLPALDDEFAKDMGEDSLAALRAQVQKNLEAEAKQTHDMTRRNHVLKALLEQNPVDAPQSMVESQTDRLVENAALRMERMVGKKVQLDDQQRQSLRQSSVAEADFQVRSGLLLLEVAKAANIKVEAADVDADIERMASDAGDYGDQVRMMYAAKDRREDLEYSLLEDKTVAHLLAHAITEDVAAVPAQTQEQGETQEP